MSITEERLAQIAARLAAATPGPWSVVQGNLNTYVTSHDEMLQARIQGLHPHDGRETNAVADADFLAHARTDCRDLLAELRATREQMAHMVNSYFESQTIRPDGEIGWPTFEQIRQRAEAAEAWAAALRAALERAKAFLLLARHPDLLGVLDAYSTIVDALAATTEG